jgi:uncharacterized delta-60 repeat protein
MITKIIKLAHGLLFLLCVSISLHAQPELDISFKGTGRVTSDFGQGTGYMAAAVVQPDNKIVGIGRWLSSSFVLHIALTRYNEDGTPDTSFGSQGRVVQPGGVGNAGAIQPDGRIIVAGVTSGQTPGVSNILVARYNPDGSPDTTFGSGGRVLYAFVQNANEAKAVAVGPDGSIAVAAYYMTPTNSQTVVVKLNSAGVVQWATADIRGSNLNDQNLPTSIAFQADGKIVTSGCFLPAGSQSGPVTFARYNTDGSPDITFGAQGRLLFSSSSEYIAAIAVQPDGRILGAGHAGVDIMVMRMWGNGMLDISFSDDGRATASIPVSASASSLVIRPNGKIVAAGVAGEGFAVAAFKADGMPDTSFSGDGALRFTFPEFPSGATSAGLDHLGRIVLGGVANSKFAAARLYTLDPVPVTVTGQTVTMEGTPLRNIRVGLTNQDGQTRWAITSAFGYFVFDNVPTGQTYTLFVRGSKHYSFETRDFGVNEATDNLTLIGNPIGPKPSGDSLNERKNISGESESVSRSMKRRTGPFKSIY